MILSSAGHSLLGWKLLGAELTKANAGGELIQSLGLGWHFAGAAMLAFGLVVVAFFRARLKGAAGSVTPAIVIGATYVLYGGWAMAVSGFDPFFLVFVVPGLMVLFASLGP
jgi:hypothetical protein